MYISLAWRNLWRNKRRTLIASASVFFAVFFAIGMRSMQLGSYDNMVDNIVRFYTGYAQIHQKGFWDEQSLDNSFISNDTLISRAMNIPGMARLIPRLESFALVSSGLHTRGVMVVGVDPEEEERLTNLSQKTIRGKYFSGDDNSALLTSDLANFLNVEPGDTIVILGQGYHGANAAGKYSVSGIVKFNSPELNKRFLFLPLHEAQWLFYAEDRLTSLVVMTDAEKVDGVVKSLRNDLGAEYEVLDWKQMVPELVQAIEADSIGGIIVLCILYLVIGFGIFGTVLMMTAERQHEFGVLVALGMKRYRILGILALEGVFLTLIGLAIGTLASFPIVAYFHRHPIPLSDELKQVSESYGMEAIIPFSVAPEIFGYQALTVMAIALLSMAYPLVRILSLEPSQAMRA